MMLGALEAYRVGLAFLLVCLFVGWLASWLVVCVFSNCGFDEAGKEVRDHINTK